VAVAGSPRKIPEQRRQDLVLAAFELLAEKGFEGLRTRDVAARAGVNIATLHYYFPTKEALIGGVVEHVMTRFRSTLEPHGSPDRQLRNHLRAVRKLMREEPEVGAVMGELALRSARDPAIAALVRSTQETWHRVVRGLLRRAAKEGYIQPDLDSDAVAAMVLATLTAMTLPLQAAPRHELALRQLERWLGLPSIT
jgi:AcrR family transcriptional regulator